MLLRIRDDAKRQSEEEFESRESQRGRRASKSLRSSLRRSFFGQDSAITTPAPDKEPDRTDSTLGDLSAKLILSGHTATVSDLAFHPGKPVLFTASHDATIRMYNSNTGASVGSFGSDCGKAIWACRFSSDGSIFATGTGDGAVEFWASKNPNAVVLLFSFRAHRGFVDQLDFSGDGLRLATGSGTKVLLWKLKPADWYLAREQHSEVVPEKSFPLWGGLDLSGLPSGEQTVADEESTAHPSFDHSHFAHPSEAVTNKDMVQLLENRRAALTEEESIVNALHIAVQKRQDDVDALGMHAAALAAKRDRRQDLRLPSWGLVSDDAEYLEKLRARKRVLYERVGRAEVKGDTATLLAVAQLHPHDLERIARFEELRQLGGAPPHRGAF